MAGRRVWRWRRAWMRRSGGWGAGDWPARLERLAAYLNGRWIMDAAMKTAQRTQPRASRHSLTLVRVFDVPRAAVFEGWTRPEHLARWWAPEGFTTPMCKVEARPGGAIRIHLRGPDGAEHPLTGVFMEVVPPRRIVLVASPLAGDGKALLKALTTATFAERNGKTRLTLRMRISRVTPAAAPYLAGMEEGWKQALARLDALLAQLPQIQAPGGQAMATWIGAPARSEEQELVLTRVFDAPRELVFQAWTQPEHAAQWWGPAGLEITHMELEARPGGTWRKCMRAPDGREYWRHGVYREVVPPERLVFTYFSDDPHSRPEHEMLVTVTLEDLGGRTRLTLRQTKLESLAARESHRTGWLSTLERLAAHLKRE